MENQNEQRNNEKKARGIGRAMPIILAALAIFIAVCLFTSGSGVLGGAIGKTLLGLFSYAAYALPVMLLVQAFAYNVDVAEGSLAKRAVFSVSALVSFAAAECIIYNWSASPEFSPVKAFSEASAGGFIGNAVGFALSALLGNIGALIFICAYLLIFSTFFFADKLGSYGKAALGVGGVLKNVFGKAKGAIDKKIEDERQIKKQKEDEEHIRRSNDLMDDSFFNGNSGVDDLRIDDGKAVVTPVTPDPEPQKKQRKKHRDKPVDLEFNLERPEVKAAAEEAPKEEPAPEEIIIPEAPKTRDDSADSVFTKDFDPLNFATEQKHAQRMAAKPPVAEELDELVLPEKKPTLAIDEQRRAEFERRRQMLMNSQRVRSVGATPSGESRSSTAPSVTPTEAPTVTEAPRESTPPVFENHYNGFENAPERAVRDNTDQPKTSSSFTQPVPAVEFTITAEPKRPVSETASTPSYQPSGAPEESAEDVAKAISARIARNTPGYARSANELKTYTKEIDSTSYVPEVRDDITCFPAAETEVTNVPEVRDDAAYFPAAETEVTNVHEISADASATDSPIAIDTGDGTAVVDRADSDDSGVFEFSGEIVEPDGETPPQVNEIILSDDNSASEPTRNDPEGLYDESLFDVDLSETPENAEDALEEVSEDEAVSANVGDEDDSATRSSYARAAAFAAELNGFVAQKETQAPENPTPVFKQYETPSPDVTTEAVAIGDSTLKIERSMLSPTPTPIITEKVAEAVTATVPAAVGATGAMALDGLTEAPSVSVYRDDKEKPVSVTEPTKADDADTPYTILSEDSFFGEEKGGASEPSEPLASATVEWQPDEESASSVSTPADECAAVFVDEDSEDSDGESDITVEMPEEENAPFEEIPPEEQNPDVAKLREMFPFLNPIGEIPDKKSEEEPATETPAPVAEEAPETAPCDEEKPEEKVDLSNYINEDLPPFDNPTLKREAAKPALAVQPFKEEKKKADFSNFEFPSIELLSKEESSTDDNIQSEIQENADRLIETLSSFNVTASIKGVDRGPRITRYEVVPAKGVKVSSILNLQDDIALNLAAGAIRMEAPIPGKSAVGIEIPNKTSSIVRLRDLIETADFQSTKSKTAVCIGRDVAGQPVFGDIAKMPHLLIAGATGMGKSVCINSLMISMLFKARPDEVKFIMIDPKQVEFTMYNGIPHLLVPVVTDPKQAAGSLMWAVEEMERRYNLLYPLCVRNIDAYNEKVAADPSLGEFLPRIVIVIDEFADLMLQVKDPVENLVMRIAQKARAAGIYLIIGTQRPSVNVITGVIKANVPSRISCKVMSNVDSKTVLDSAGAEKLLDRGDMLYAPAGALKPHRVQGAFVADSEVEAIMDHLKKFSDGSTYDSSVMEEIERAAQKCSKKGSGGGASDYDDDEPTHGEGFMNDRQFLDAVEVAVNTRKISTSLIQRKLSIGYGKAAKFIDIMEEKGIVGESNGQRPREVLVTPEEWREMLARITIDD